MPARITLTVTQGKLKGATFVFEERTTCILGRAADCDPRVPDDVDHKTISRHHCLLDINPPDIRIRDFGSLNGTFINGIKIGQREKGQTPEEAARISFPERDLNEGDEIKLSDTVLRVSLFLPTFCIECNAEIPESQKAGAFRSSGVYQCEDCHCKAEQAQHKGPLKPKPKVCVGCGKDVAREMGKHQHGEFFCADCRTNPQKLIQRLLDLADRSNEQLRAIQGYSLLRELGRGMGVVYLARNNRTGEQVALKIMLPQVAADGRATTKFLREMENTRALRHRHVVEFRDMGCTNSMFFFTLEYCEGGSLQKMLQERQRPLPIGEACELVLQALDGLQYAHTAEVPFVSADGVIGHSRGLVHRDIKPANLFLAGSGQSRIVKVGDYGLAKAFDMAGLSGQTLTGDATWGTPFFLPRQQVVNFRCAKPEVDVWATAASLYYLLTYSFPRNFPDRVDRWQVVLQSDAIPIRQRDAVIPKKVAEVIDYALVDNPQIGFKTAIEFKQALESAL